MRVAVVTPYYRESESILRHCHNSVLAQSHPCEHIMVADGHPMAVINGWQCHHSTLPLSHNDNGNTPRTIGSLFAINQGFDAIAYLDADNWYQPNHIASLVQAHHEQAAPVCASDRSLHRADGSLIPVDEPLDGIRHIDTSCLFLTRYAFNLCPLWAMMPPMLSPICDRIFYTALTGSKFKVAYTRLRTLAFRSQYACHYEYAGETAPTDAKGDVTSEPIRRWNSLEDEQRQMYFRRLGFRFSLE